jgi:hypothetical protein
LLLLPACTNLPLLLDAGSRADAAAAAALLLACRLASLLPLLRPDARPCVKE